MTISKKLRIIIGAIFSLVGSYVFVTLYGTEENIYTAGEYGREAILAQILGTSLMVYSKKLGILAFVIAALEVALVSTLLFLNTEYKLKPELMAIGKITTGKISAVFEKNKDLIYKYSYKTGTDTYYKSDKLSLHAGDSTLTIIYLAKKPDYHLVLTNNEEVDF